MAKRAPLPGLLNREQVAELLGIAVETLDLWTRRGDGPPRLLLSARTVRYRPAELEAWLDARRRARRPAA